MRLILDNVSKRDYEWLLSMAKALKFKVAVEGDIDVESLEEIDKALGKTLSESLKTDFSYAFGKEEIQEFQERKDDYLTGKSQTTSWNAIKKQYDLL